MQSTVQDRSLGRFITLATYVLIGITLWLARDVLIPVAAAGLLAFLLSPVVAQLMRWGLAKLAAIAVTVTLALAVMAALAFVVVWQTYEIAAELPQYERNIRAKIELVRSPQTPAALALTSRMIEDLRREFQATPPAVPTPAADQPVPVEVREPEPTAFELSQEFLGALAGPLGTAGIVIVLMAAILIQAEDLRDRLIQAVSAGRINIATQALDDAARRVSRYLFMQFVVNATYGIPVGIMLAVIGVPGATLWGLLATVLRFVPFIGPWIAAAFPVVLALAVDPGWTMVLWTLVLFLVMELVSNNIIEVWLYGTGTGISNFALLVGAVFWTWLWGPMGLVLATPLTACLLVLGRHVPGLKFLSTLLGSEPVLEPPAQFYQRLLSMDADRVQDLAVAHVEKHSLTGFYDEIFLPALLMAEEDRHSGALAEVRQQFIVNTSKELIEDLERRSGGVSIEPDAPTVHLLPARDDADEIAARMLCHLLRERGIAASLDPVTVAPADALDGERWRQWRAVIVSALPPSAVSSARRILRQLEVLRIEVPAVAGIWSRRVDPADIGRRIGGSATIPVASRLADAVAIVESLLREETSAVASNPSAAQPDPLGLSGSDSETWFDIVLRDLARAFDVPVAMVSLTEADRSYWDGRAAVPDDAERVQQISHEVQAGIRSEDGLCVVEDTAEDSQLQENAFLRERGIRFFAGAALRESRGRVVGRLCVVDTQARKIDDRLRDRLRARAAELIAAAETRPGRSRSGQAARGDGSPATRVPAAR